MHTFGQVRVDKYCPRQSQRKRQLARRKTTVLWRLMEKVNLLVSKFFLAVHRSSTESQSRPDYLVCRFYWSTGAAGGLSMVDSGTCLQGEFSKKNFCDSFCEQSVDLDREEGAGGPTIARSLSCARSLAMSVSARSLVWSYKEQYRKSGRRDLLKWMSFVLFFLLHCETVACKKWAFFHQWCRLYLTMANASWPSHFAFPLWSAVFIFWWFVCLLFALPHWFCKKLDEKHKKQTSCPKCAGWHMGTALFTWRHTDIQTHHSKEIILGQSHLLADGVDVSSTNPVRAWHIWEVLGQGTVTWDCAHDISLVENQLHASKYLPSTSIKTHHST